MHDPTKISALGATPGLTQDAVQAPRQAEGADGAAFRALLEKMEQSAHQLRRASESLDSPAQLGPAVESARHSVEQALTLGSDLLEAFRAAVHRGELDPDHATPAGRGDHSDVPFGSGGGH